MARLRAAERELRAAIEDLIRLGAIRSHVLVGDLGELIAARYYGAAATLHAGLADELTASGARRRPRLK